MPCKMSLLFMVLFCRNGFAVPLTDETKKKLEKVLDLLEVGFEY